MSRTVDERVVSMQFDNKQFESNAATTMSTLEKLKQKLNLSGASKGLSDINSAVSKCDMSPLGNAVDGVKTKFSALEVMSVTALANITNSAVNAGKKMLSALTIDPVKTGLSEYETQINATQTILANTQSKGSTIDDVNQALKELNDYADMTIYNFTEMTRNIGTFTAAGVDLDTATNAIKGIANLAAVSGSTSQQASTAMYQLSQALASGTVKLMDWNSVVNAGMGGQVFQDALKETARIHGVAIDDMIEKEGSFRETLSSGWLTSEILTDTLNKFTLYAKEGTKEWDEYIASLKQKGYTEEQAREILKLGKTATEAATKVKTFTQLWDVLKEAAQSGWSQSWKIIIGDFEQAKELLSPLADVLTGIIGKFSDARNFFLEGVLAFNKPWEAIQEKLNSIKDVGDKIKSITGDLEYFQDVVHRVWMGEFNNQGDNPDRRDLLKAAGYDPRVVQTLVNLGYQHKITAEEVAAAHEKYGLTMETSTEETEELTTALNSLTDEQLKNAGLTEDEIKLYRDLEKEANRLGISVDELAEKMSTNTGRDLLIDSFKNVGDAILGLFKSIGTAWSEFFSGPSIARTYTLIESINKFTERLRFTNKETGELTEVGEKFHRIFKGVFAAIHVATTVLGGPLKLVFTLFTKILGAFNLDILGFAANISDLIVKFHDWFLENNFVMKGIEKLAGLIANGIRWVKEWFNAFKQLEFVQEFWTSFTSTIERTVSRFKLWSDGFRWIFGDFFDAIRSMDEITFDGVLDALVKLRDDILKHFESFPRIFRDLLVPIGKFGKALLEHIGIYDEFEKAKQKVEELADAFKTWFKGLREADDPIQYVIDSIKNGFKNLVTTVKEYWAKIWGVLSGASSDDNTGVSESGEEIGTNLVQGIIRGIWEGIKTIFLVIKTLCVTIVDTAKEMLGIHSPSVVFFAIGGFIIAGLIAGMVAKSTGLFSTIGDIAKNIVDKFKNSGILGGIKNFGVKIGLGIGSVIGWIRDHFDSIAVIIGALAAVLTTFKLTNVISNLTDGLGELFEGLGDMFRAIGKARQIKAQAKLILSYAIGIGILAAALYFMAKLEWNEIGRGAAVIAGLAVVLGGLTIALSKLAVDKGTDGKLISSKATSLKKTAVAMVGIAASIAILAYAIKLVDGVNDDNIWRNLAVIGILAVGMAGLAIVMSKLAPQMTKGSLSIIAISAAVLLLVLALNKLNMLTIDDPAQTVGSLLILVAGLALVARACKGISGKATFGLIGMVLSIYLFMGLLKKISKMDIITINRGMSGITKILLMFAGMMLVTKLAGQNAKTAGAALFAMSAALLLVTFAIKMLGNMDADALKNGVNAMSQIMIVFGLMVALSKFTGANAAKAGVMLVGAAVAVLILVGAISLLSRIDDVDGLKRATAVISILLTLFAGLIFVSQYATKATGSLIALAVTIGVLIAAVGLLTLLDPKKLAYATIALSTLTGVLALLIASLKFVQTAKGTCIKTISTLLILGGIIVLLAFCLKQLGELEPQKVLGVAGALSLLMLSLATSLLIMSKAKMMDATVVGTAIVMAMLIAAIGVILGELQHLDPDKSIKIAAVLGTLLLAVSAACLILSKSKWIDNSTLKAAMLMGVILAEIALVLAICQWLNVDAAYNNVVALGTLLLVISAACLILSKCSYVSSSAIKAVMAIGVVLAEIALVLALCQALKVDAALNNVVSLGGLLLVISAACLILSKAKRVDKSAIKAAMAMGVVLAEIALVLAICQWLNVDAAYNNVASLGALLLVISGACFILSKCSHIGNDAIVAAMAMGVVLAEIAAVLWLCQKMGVDAALNNVLALSALLIVLSAACLILDRVKTVSPGALLAVAALGLIMLELGWVLSKILEMNISPCIGIVLTLSVLLIALSVVTGVLSKIGPSAANAIPAAASMIGVIAIIGGIALAIGGLMSLISPETIEKWSVGLQSFMDFIVILATGLGEAIGGLIGGTLEGIGQGLSDFMTNLQGFIEGAKSIDVSMAEGMKALGAAILAITAANILDGLSKLLGLGSMDELGVSMASFGGCMIAFAQSISSLTEEDIARIKMAAEAGKAMGEMESAVPKQGGWWQTIVGSSDMADFGTRMKAFGGSLVAFSGSIADLTEDDIAKIKLAADAGSALAGLESGIPKQGGWWQEIAGASDMADFGSRMKAFGGSLVAFAGSVANLTEDDIAKITMTADAGNAMAALEDSIPRKGGWWQDIVGEKDIATFGNSMVAFGDAIIKYSKKVSGLDENAATNIENSKAAAKALVGVYDVLPEDDGWWGKVTGETDASAFGTGMYDLAKGLAKYATAAAELDDDAATNIKNSKDAVKALKDVAGVITGEGIFNAAVGNCANVATFGTSMVSLAGSLKDYSSAVSEGIDITSIENSKTAIIAMADAAKALPNDGGLAGLIAGENGDITTFGSKMVTLAGQVMTYAATVSAITAEELAAIALSSLAIGAMAAAAKALPNEGGLAGLLAGENGDIAGFGSKMVTLAGQVMTYASTVANITEDDVTAIRNSKTAIIAMAQAAKALPNEGGLAGLLAGENGDITGFGVKMVALATSLNMYIASISGITEESISRISLSGDAIAALAGVGARASSLTNVNIADVSTASTNLLNVATLLNQYTGKIAGITEATTTKIVMSGNAIFALAGVASKAALLNNFGTGVSDAAINQLGKLVNLAKGMAGVNFSPMSAFAQNLAALGEAGVTQFVNAFTNSYDRVSTAGMNMVNMLCQGVQSGSDNVVVAVTLVTGYMLNALSGSVTLFYTSGVMLMSQLASGIGTGGRAIAIAVTTSLASALTAISGQYISWYNTGAYLVAGFASGISANSFKAAAAASAMAQAALNAAKEKLKINSPSKVFRDIVGMAVPEGFAAGIDKFAYMVTDSTTALEETALQGAKKAIAKLADYVDTDIDTQPTIRPVLDLSDVSSGISTMGNLFDVTPSIGVLANVGSISSMMNNSRYGSNDDVVDAINKLGKGIGDMDRTTNIINGITYDDGSAMSEAVGAVIRAARIGGRV